MVYFGILWISGVHLSRKHRLKRLIFHFKMYLIHCLFVYTIVENIRNLSVK